MLLRKQKSRKICHQALKYKGNCSICFGFHCSIFFVSFSSLTRLGNNYSKLTHWIGSKKKFSSGLKKSLAAGLSLKTLKTDQANQETTQDTLESDHSSKVTSNFTREQFFNLVKSEDNQALNEHFFTLIYLASPVDNSSNDKDHAVFIYPKLSDSDDDCLQLSKRILKLKGMFVSLVQIIDDITGQLPTASKIYLYCKSNSTYTAESLNFDTNIDQLVNAAYVQEFNNTLVLCVAQDHLSELEVTALVSAVARLIRFMYNSLDAAFKNIDNHSNLNHIMEILNSQLDQKYLNQNICFLFDSVQRLMIDEDLLLNIDEALYEYESLDWLSDECSIDNGLSSNVLNLLIIGSCLFHRGYLISSHLSPNYLSDIISFLKFRGLLTLTRDYSNRLTIWREVFPSISKPETLFSDFTVNEGTRYFLLVVGIERTLLATLLEMPFMAADPKVKPNSVIINQTIRFISSHLKKSGLVSELNHHIQAQAFLYTSSLNHDSLLSEKSAFKSLSMKELLHFGLHRDDLNSSSCNYSNSSISSPQSSLNKSQSTPSLPQSSIINTQHNQSNASTESTQTSDSSFCCETELDECDCSSFISNWLDYYSDDYRYRFPRNFIFYLDIDFKTRSYLGPVFLPNGDKASAMVSQLYEKFRECCLFISDQMSKLYPEVNKFGSHFSIKREPLVSANTKAKSKRIEKLESDNEARYWVICHKDSIDRELYILYKAESKEKEITFNFKIEPLLYRLAL